MLLMREKWDAPEPFPFFCAYVSSHRCRWPPARADSIFDALIEESCMRARVVWIMTLSSLTVPSFAADETFFHEAARGGMAEVALGQLAVTKGTSDEIKTFGRLMVDEHGAANVKLKAAAAKSGVKLPVELGEDTLAARKELESLSGNAFDLEYVDSQRKAHAQTIALLEKEVASGTDPAAKAWASEALLTVKRHAEMIGSLDSKAGEHHLEHGAGTPGPADAPPATTPR
jgi:putative membrane protein